MTTQSNKPPQSRSAGSQPSERCRGLAAAWHARGLEAEVEEAAALRAAAAYLESSLELMHHLQRERGASCLYLGTGGAGYREHLDQLRTATDLHLAGFLDSLPPPDQTGATPLRRVGFRQAEKLATLLLDLALLAEQRVEIDRCRAPGRAAHAFYTELLARLLAFIFSTSDSLPAAAAMPIYVALYYLAEAKELAGQERAWGSLCLAAGAVTREDLEILTDLIERQEQSLAIFQQIAGGFSSGPINLEHHAAESHIEKLRRQMALAAGESTACLPEPAVWFDAATLRMDHWRGLEQSLLQKLKDACGTGRGASPRPLESRDASSVIAPPAAPMASGNANELPRAVASSLAGMLAAQARRIRELDEELAAARRALEERKVLDRAKGLLIKHRGMSEPEAHRFLREEAMRRGRKITDLAALLLESNELWNQK